MRHKQKQHFFETSIPSREYLSPAINDSNWLTQSSFQRFCERRRCYTVSCCEKMIRIDVYRTSLLFVVDGNHFHLKDAKKSNSVNGLSVCVE